VPLRLACQRQRSLAKTYTVGSCPSRLQATTRRGRSEATGETCVWWGLWAWPGPAYGRQRRRRSATLLPADGRSARQLAAGGRSGLRESSTCPTLRFNSDSAWGTSSTASTNGALTIAPVSHSLGWRESVGGRGADEAGGGAEKQLEAGAGPGLSLEGESLVDGALRGGRSTVWSVLRGG